jgi:hypothetical protein
MLPFNRTVAEVGAELRWTADAQSATEASAACWLLLVAPRLIIMGGVLALVLTVVFGWSNDRGGDPDPWMHGLGWGLGYAALFTIAMAACGFVSTVRANKRRLPPGTEIVAVWNADSVLFVSPFSEVRLPLSTFSSVRVLRFWVAIKQSTTKSVTVWPRDLFPDAELARLPVSQSWAPPTAQ